MIQNPRTNFRYRLSDNVKIDRMNINGIDLSKNWMTFDRDVTELKNHIRTKDNPDNIVDYEKFNADTQTVLKSSWVDFKKFLPYYSKDTLAAMPRVQLEIICNAYNIPTANLTNPILIQKILEKQEVFKVKMDEEREKRKKELLIEIAETAARKIIEEKFKDCEVDSELIKEVTEKVVKELETTIPEDELKKN